MSSRIFDRHVGTYQNYPIQGIAFKRGEGLAPEGGSWVDLNLEQVRTLDVDWKPIPWRGVNGKEVPGQLSFHTWDKVVKATLGESDPGEIPQRQAGGFNLFGNLVLYSVMRDGSKLTEPQVYRDVYVDVTALEEIETDLAQAKSHSKGRIRVPLTDVRSYYPDHGALVCRINVVLKNGSLDPDSIQSNGKRVPLSLALPFLFSQLPGSPMVLPSSDIYQPDMKDLLESACPSIEAEGEPTVEHLQKLLDELGLKPKYQPSGNYEVNRRVSARPVYGELCREPGKYEPIGTFQRAERKSVTFSRRPPLVQVFGKRPIRRITIPYIPVIQDEDGLFFRLADIESIWGYKLEDLNRQVLNPSALPFKDVPADTTTQRFNRIAMLQRWAYRGYLPATAFPEGVTAVSVADLVDQPFLPLTDFAAYLTELKDLGQKATSDSGEGDKGAYALVHPVARGLRVGQGFFKDMDAIEDYFKELKAVEKASRDDLDQMEKTFDVQIADFGATLLAAQNSFKASLQQVDSVRASLSKLLPKSWRIIQDGQQTALTFKLQRDVELAIKELGLAVPFENVLKFISADSIKNLAWIQDLTKSKKDIAERKKKSEAMVATWDEELAQFKTVYSGTGAIKLARMNLPFGPLDGLVKLDRTTGLLVATGGEPLCQADKPFLMHASAGTVVQDGGIVVTAGYELRGPGAESVTSALFSIDGEGSANDKSGVSFVGFNRPSPIKARAARLPSMRMYQNDLGNAINGNEVKAQAEAKARPLLDAAPKTFGYTHVLDGFQKAACGGATSAVIHSYEPERSAVATTTIMINNPGGRTFEGGIGAVFPPNRPAPVGQAQIRDAIETATGDL